MLTFIINSRFYHKNGAEGEENVTSSCHRKLVIYCGYSSLNRLTQVSEEIMYISFVKNISVHTVHEYTF